MASQDKTAEAGPRVDHVNRSGSVDSHDSANKDDIDVAIYDADAAAVTTQWVDETPEEKKLRRKLDLVILPCTWILYMLGHLDRANVGNAKTGGMAEDFNMTSTQYSIIVLIFFPTYVLCEVPSNMILTRVRPSIFLPGLGIAWGIIATLGGVCQSWSQLAGLRVLLGVAEAGFAPGCAFYLSSWYRRYELATRYSWLYTSVPISGMFSGLLAGVIIDNMDGSSGIAGWRWLFIIEGLMSVVASLVIFFVMPDYPSNSKRLLNEEEMILACNRLAVDGIALTQGTDGNTISHKTALKMAVTDWRTWAQCLMFTLVTGSQTMHYFIPTLVQSFGWHGTVAQYHTIPAYAAALVFIMFFCWLSDKLQRKWQVVAGLSGFGTILFILVTVITDKTARYGLGIFAFATIYACSPLVKTWVADTIPQPPEKRAIAIALINAIGNSSSIYASWLWPKSDAPRYIPGFSATTSWMGILCVCSVVFGYFFLKYPIKRVDPTQAIAAEVEGRRKAQQPGEKA